MKKKLNVSLVAIAVMAIVVIVIIAIVYLPEQEDTKLTVIYAGSLVAPFDKMEQAFESEHPGVDVVMEGHGSIQAIRQVTDIHREVDVLAVADESLIPDMMYYTYADAYVMFSTNQMVIAYTNNSKYADEINNSNWYEILTREDVQFGFSNPMLDACGYRALMVVQLAEMYYNNKTIFNDLIECNFDPAITEEEDFDNDTRLVLLPEVIKPLKGKVVIRGGSVQLIPLLELGEIDYAFEYKSIAKQQGLQFIELPVEIDLSSPEYADIYRKVVVQLGFQRFKSMQTQRIAKPIFYAITVPKGATHPQLAEEFMEFVLSEKGLKILQDTEQPTIIIPENHY
jgi:molybdate/tungstate transport system substrate-binding protein